MAKQFDIKTVWKDKMAFDSHVGNHVVRMDTMPELGDDSGASPKHLVLAGLAGCSGMDVVSLLRKMRVDFTGFEIQVLTELTEEEHPHVFAAIHMIYRVEGKNLDKEKVKKAVDLSQERYCGVSAMLKKNGPVEYSIEYSES